MVNRCGECNRCCVLFSVKEIDKYENVPCPFWDRECTIYDTRPKACVEFNCAWLQGKNVSEDLRPDKCGILFEKISGRLFFGTLDPEVEVTELGEKQVWNFVSQGYSVVLASPISNVNQLFLAEGHTKEEIMVELNRNIERYGNI